MGFLRTCCCGCTLRTGTIIIGSLSLTCATLYLCLILAAIPLVEQASDEINRDLNRNSRIDSDFSTDLGSPSFNFESKSSLNNFKISLNDLESENGITSDQDNSVAPFNFKSFTIELLSICAVGASISVITSILLLVGAAKGYMWLHLPWIANVSLGLIVYVITSIYQLVRLSQMLSAGGIFLSVCLMFLILALDFYVLMVVISNFEELRRNKREEGSNLGKIYSAPGPWSSSTTEIIPNLPVKDIA